MKFFKGAIQTIGLLNLAILLPSSALVLYIKYTNSIYPKQRVIEVVWTNDKALRTNPSIERFERRLTKTENKKYKQFGLLDGCKHDREELKLIRKETQKVILLQDTTIGIHIHLGPDTKLWTVGHCPSKCVSGASK